MFDELYIEEGYVETGYFVYTANAEIELDIIATKLTAAGIIGDFFVPLDNNASLLTQAEVIYSSSSNLSSNSTVSADAEVIRGFASVQTVTSTLSEISTRIRPGDSNQTVTSTLSEISTRIRNIDSNQNANFVLSDLSTRIRIFNSAFVFTDNQDATGNIIANGSANLNVKSLAQISKWNFTGRPRNPIRNDFPTRTVIDTNVKIQGNGSLRLDRNPVLNASSDSNGRIYYDADTIPTGEDFAIEFWIRLGNDSPNVQQEFGVYHTLFSLTQTGGTQGLKLAIGRFNNNTFLRWDSGAFGFTSNTLTSPARNTWLKAEISRNNGNLVAKVNNQTLLNDTNNNSFSAKDLFFYNPFRSASEVGNYSILENVWFDSFSFRVGDSTLFGSAVPTNNFDTTQQIYLFDQDFNDYLGITEQAQASLTTTANLLLKFPETISGIAELQSNFNVSANADKVKTSQADLLSSFALTSDIDKIKSVDADLLSSFAIESTPGFVFEPEIFLEAVATKLTAAGIIGDFFVNADIVATVSAEPSVIRNFNADITGVFSTDAQIDRIRTAEFDADSEFAVNCLTGYLQDLNAELISEFVLSGIPEGIIPGTGELFSEFAISIDADRIKGTAVELVSEFAVDCDANQTFNLGANLTVVSAILADSIVFKIILAEADISAQFALTASGAVSNIRQYVYTIPRETRTINIVNENRTIKVRR
jgi:hypothetical protein